MNLHPTSASRILVLPVCTFVLLATFVAGPQNAEGQSGQGQGEEGKVTALGRLEPRGGVIRVAGPSQAAVVISELFVAEGDVLEKGQVIARLDSHARNRARVQARVAELEEAERELGRSAKLRAGRAASAAARDTAEMRVKVAKANLAEARAELALSEVRAPIDGQVLALHALEGERVDSAGIIELGRTGEMYAIAEVYETDIGRVKAGQAARITSPALAGPLTGQIERVGLMVAKMDVLGTDPIARTDARVIEVDVRLDPGQDVGKLTYLQVTVEITPQSK
jgi:HlyD family secretion protein